MLLFSIVSLPALFLLLKGNIKYKDITLFFLGVLISSLLSLITWSLSTFFQPEGISLVTKSFKLILNSVSPLIVLSLFYFVYYIFDWKVKLPSDSFKCGFIYWNMLFSIIQESSEVKSLVLPIFYMLVLITLIYVERVVFKMKDNIIKGLYYILLPFYILASLLVIYYSNVGTAVLGSVSLVVLIVVKFNFKNIKNIIFIYK